MESIYDENGVLEHINELVASGDYFENIDIPLYLYGRTNFEWNPICARFGLTSAEVESLVQEIKSSQ